MYLEELCEKERQFYAYVLALVLRFEPNFIRMSSALLRFSRAVYTHALECKSTTTRAHLDLIGVLSISDLVDVHIRQFVLAVCGIINRYHLHRIASCIILHEHAGNGDVERPFNLLS